MTTISNRVWAELVLLSLIWGGSFLAIRIALDELPFVTSVAHRVFWAALALWCTVWWRGTPVPHSSRIWASFAIMGILNNVLPFSLMAWGQLFIETGLTSILNAATAIWGVLIAALVFRDERLTLQRGIGVALGFVGVATAVGVSNLLSLDLRSLAQIAVIAGTVSYAFAGVWARAKLSDLDPVVAAAGMLTASACIMVPAALVIDGAPSTSLQTSTILAVAYYSLIATALAYLLYYRILAQAVAGNVLLCTLLIAPIAIVLGALVRDETLDTQAYFGFALLGLGLVVLDGRALRVFAKAKPS